MAEVAESWSPLKVALVERLLIPKVKSEVQVTAPSIISQNSLQSYVLELKRAIMIMTKYIPIEITTPFKGNCLLVTSCQQFFVFGSIEGRVAVVGCDTKEIIHDITLEGGSIFSIALINRDSILLAAGKDGIIRKFDFQNFEEICGYEGHEKEVNSIRVSPDEATLYSASDDTTVRSWGISTGDSKILYYHEKAILCLDLSRDGRTLISGGADKCVKVFDVENEIVVKTLDEFSSSVWAVTISAGNRFIAVGESTGMVKVLDFETLEVVKTCVGHEGRVSQLAFNSLESILVSASNDTTLRIWNMIEEKHEIILSGHTDWVKAFTISADESKIFSIAENYKILSWQFPKFDNSCCRKEHSSVISYMGYSKKTHLLFTADSHELKVWDITNNKSLYKSFRSPHKVAALCMDSDKITPLVAFTNNEVVAWHVDDNITSVILKHSSVISSMTVSAEGQTIVLGDYNFRVTVYSKKNKRALHVFRRHNSVVTCLVYSKPVMGESYQLFSAGEDKVIFMYNLKENKSFKFPNSHNASISALTVSRKNDLLISGDCNGVFKIWNILQQICIKSLSQHSERITAIQLSENSKYFWVASCDSSLSLWNSTNFTVVTHLKTKNPVTAFCCTNKEAEIILAENEEVQFMDNPLRTQQFFIYGPGRNYYAFMNYVLKMADDNELEHDVEMDKWMITPYEINALHFYAYFNLPQHLKKALNAYSPFYFSKSGYSPLQIAISRNFRDCINVIIKSITQRIQEDPYSVIYLEESIIKLNQIGFRGLDNFYASILFKCKDKLLPKFCDESVSLPILVTSSNLGPQQKDFLDPDMVSGFGTPITFWQSALKIDTVIGSKDSIIFLESIVDCPNSGIFACAFIRELVLYKWSYLKWVLLPQAMLYVLYMLLLSIYLIFFDGEQESLLMVIFIVNIMLALYEIFQMLMTRMIYFSDIWNYIDFLRTSLCFLYVYFVWTDFDRFASKQVLVSVTFVTMLRGISYFRLFDNTRYMINLLTEVISDMRSFLILLTYSTYSFAMVYFIMVNNIQKYNSADPTKFENQPFSEFIKSSYLLSIGNFDTEGYQAFEWAIFFFASVINPLIMLNLLIAIMGDTFGRVQEEQEIADMKELTEMVIEGEYIMFCRRSSGKKMYVQICKEEEMTTTESNLDTQLAKLKMRVKTIEQAVFSQGEEIKGDIKASIAVVNNKVDEMTELVEQINLTQD